MKTLEGSLVARATGDVPDGCRFYSRRRRVRRRSQSDVQAVDVKTGKVLWETKLATSVQGFPVSYSINGKQYVAVTTGKGGGSPWLVPNTIAPEINPPNEGFALHVFALPDKK